MSDRPSPGSRQAIEKGCRCPIMDNSRGAGRPGDDDEVLFVMNMDCPLHFGPSDG